MKSPSTSSKEDELRYALEQLWEYTKTLESLYNVWVVTRPNIAQFPENAPVIGEIVHKALGLTKEGESGINEK